MVGLLGCGCCGGGGGSPSGPTYYGPCDCSQRENVIRSTYQNGYSEPFPSDPPFKQPANPELFLYNDKLYLIKDGVFFLIPDPTFSNPPLWTASNSPMTDNQDLSLGLPPRNDCHWDVQFGLNEFDYEFSLDVTISELFKPILQWTTETWFEFTWRDYASFSPTLLGFSAGVVADDLTVVVQSYNENRTLLGYVEPSDWRVVFRYTGLGFPLILGGSFGTHTLKRRISCPSFVYPNSTTITSTWYWDNAAILTQTESSLQTSGGWVECYIPPVDPQIRRFLSCNSLYHVGSVSTKCLWSNDPSELFYVDNFRFTLIPK